MAEPLAELRVLPTFRTDPTMNAAHRRVLDADTPTERDLQLKTETLAALHQIRRMLLWMMIILLAVLVVAGAAVLVATAH